MRISCRIASGLMSWRYREMGHICMGYLCGRRFDFFGDAMGESTIQEKLDLAMNHLRAGRVADAQHLYRQVLEQEPSNVSAMLNLGVIASQMGQKEVAISLLNQVIAL